MNIASSLVRKLPTGIFSELAQRKKRCAEKGQDLIDLSIGSPDLPPHPFVVEALKAGIEDVTKYGYTLSGTQEFHEAVAYFYKERYGVEIEPHREVLQVMGSQDGLAHLGMAVLNPGDIALVPDPGYPIYEASIQIAGGTVYPMPLRAENGFLPNLASIPEDVLRKAKLMILNYPGNPVTALAPSEFFEQVVVFAKEHEILVMHDFAYSELVFDGARPQSFLATPGAKEIGIEFNSLSKTFNMAGCRIGYVLGNEEALRSLAILKSHIDYGTFYPIQKAAEVALTSDFSLLADQAQEYQRRRDVLTEGLRRAGWNVNQSPATMFIWTQIPEGWTSRQFAFALLENTGVSVTPGNAFGAQGEGYVRIALVQPVGRLEEATHRIARFLQV